MRAVLLVDVQVDFFPGGALPVPEGDAIIEPVNKLLEKAGQQGWPVVASRDWHPTDHCSFVENGGSWPSHCVRGTAGAELHPEIRFPSVFTMVHKATSPDKDAYSAFEGTMLSEHLRNMGVDELVVGGLALDYCVKATCLDARREGFKVFLYLPATRAVCVKPGDDERALEELREAGVEILEDLP